MYAVNVALGRTAAWSGRVDRPDFFLLEERSLVRTKTSKIRGLDALRKPKNPAASPLLAKKRNLAERAQKDSLVRDTRTE